MGAGLRVRCCECDSVGTVVEHLEQLIVDMKESLEREISSFRADVNEAVGQLNKRFDTQASRMDRHAALWQPGARWSRRMDEWAERVDAALEARDREIAELRERVSRLERKPS